MVLIATAGFLLGFAGSLHCVGMCGPLSLALPTSHLSPLLKTFSLFLYQCGRIITYTLLGIIFGFASRGIYITGLQRWLSITLGVVLLATAIMHFLKSGNIHFAFAKRLNKNIYNLIAGILKRNAGVAAFLALGLANGLLPCGMVYTAMAAAVSFHKVYQSASFMAMFGAGTFPMMMLVSYSSHSIDPRLKHMFRKALPFFVMGTGTLLVLRGLNLGIPYLSPALPASVRQIIGCH